MIENDLPEEVQALLQEEEKLSAEKLEALGRVLAKKRDDAVKHRHSSGIEAVWMKAEEAYHAIDDSNRAAFSSARWIKPTSLNGPVMTAGARPGGTEVKSDAYVRLTSRYVDAGTAKLTEILLPIGEKAFSFGPTPLPEIINAKNDNRQVVLDGVPLERGPRPEEVPPLPGAMSPPPQGVNVGTPPPASPAAPGTPTAGVPLTVKDFVEETIELATTAAKKAERRVYDWMVEAKFPAEVRKIIFDACRIGVGVLKGPYPKKRVSRAVTRVGGKAKVELKTDFVPSYSWTDPWNLYPDPACGENIQDGDHLFEVDFFSAKQLRDLRGQPGYLTPAIDKVLKEGPNKGASEDTNKPGDKFSDNRFPVWYHYGTVTRDELMAAQAIGVSEKSPETIYAIATMVNDTVIRAVVNPLESGEFPYHAVPWQRRAGFWAGVGVGEQLEMPQRAINAATRAMFNNAGKSAGSIIVMDQGSVVPADGSDVVTPDKIYLRTADSIMDDVRKAFAFFQIPNVTPQMLSIIEYCLRMAEEATSIPLVTQGQSGKTTPDTYGATQLQNNNANQLLRSIGYAFDDYITEPVVRQSYEMLLLDPDVPDEEKGDWVIDAHGSIALVERAIEAQSIEQMGQIVLNPAFGINPKRWIAEHMRTKHLTPKTFQYTEAEQAKIDAQPAQVAPAVQVAQIRSQDKQAELALDKALAELSAQIERETVQAQGQTKLNLAGMKRQVDEMRIQKDTDRDTVYVQAEAARTQQEFAARMEELRIKREIALLDYANKRDMTLDTVKADLAKESMRLQTQKELAGVAATVDLHKNAVKQVATPGVEPRGKAKPGKAFQA